MANAGVRLTRDWRWNGKPLRVRIKKIDAGYTVEWQRWFRTGWRVWRSYVGTGSLHAVLMGYRVYAHYWRTGDY